MESLLINGNVEYVGELKDFIELVDKYMGLDSADYLRSLLSNRSNIEDALSEIVDLADSVADLADSLSSMTQNLI